MDYEQTEEDAVRVTSEVADAATDALSRICKALGPVCSDVKVTVEVERSKSREAIKFIAKRNRDEVAGSSSG